MYSIAWWQLMLGGPLSTAWQNSNRQSKDMTCIQPHHFLWLQHFLQDLGLDCCYEYALGAAHVAISWSMMQASNMDLVTGLYVKRCTGFTSARGMLKQLSHNLTVVLMVILALSYLWNSRHQGGISISPEPYVPSMEKWITCHIISASRLRALVGNWLTWPWKWVLRPYRKIDLFTWEIQGFLDCCQVSGPSSCDSSDGCRMNLAARVFQFKKCFRRLVDVTTLLHQVHVSLKKWWNEKSCICGLGPTVWSPQTLTQDINSNGWKHNEAIATQNHLKWWTILKDVNPLNFFVPLASITWFLHHFCKFH